MDNASELFVYKASAGSGKTFTLAVEYIKLLIANPTAYRNILAVTFTNKATTEMKERILGQLFGIAIGDAASDAYLNVVSNGLGLSPEEVRDKARRALSLLIHDYSRFRVETIDSFFQSVMRNLARELELQKYGGCILSYNGGKIIDCRTGETLYQKQLDAQYVPELCAFAAAQDIAILTYNREGIVCERDKDEWANKECFTTKLPMIHVDDLASYVNYPVCKMLITLDPARRDAVCAAGQQQFAGRADLYPSSPFFIEAVPLGVAKDGSLAELLRRMGLTRENLMACGDGLNDRSMIAYAGVGVAMQNAEQPVKDCADYVTTADNNHDGVAEAVEKFILRED